MPLFDSHCHLQDQRLFDHLGRVMARAASAGVDGFLCCGVNEHDWDRVLEIGKRFPHVRPALGLHPLYAQDRTPKWLERLERLLGTTSAVMGEIGLDQSYKGFDFKDQEEVFVAQLQLAVKLNKAVSVHCRKAWNRLEAVLKSVGVPKAGFVIHSYSGGKDLVEKYLQLGASFSFSGSITLPNNRRGCDAVVLIPRDRLLIETDSPDIMPVVGDFWPEKDAVNEPANLLHVAAKVADVRKISVEEVAAITSQNACRVFGPQAG